MVEPEKIKKYARERVKEITESLRGLIDSFESDFQKHLQPAYPCANMFGS